MSQVGNEMDGVLGVEVGTQQKERSAEKIQRGPICVISRSDHMLRAFSLAENSGCVSSGFLKLHLQGGLWVGVGGRPIPWAFVTWKEKKDRGRRVRSSGVGTWRHGGRSHTRSPSGGEDGGEVQSCCRGPRVLLMEKCKELEFF